MAPIKVADNTPTLVNTVSALAGRHTRTTSSQPPSRADTNCERATTAVRPLCKQPNPAPTHLPCRSSPRTQTNPNLLSAQRPQPRGQVQCLKTDHAQKRQPPTAATSPTPQRANKAKGYLEIRNENGPMKNKGQHQTLANHDP